LEQKPLKNAVLQGFSLKNCMSLVQNRAPGYAGNVSAQSISFGTGSNVSFFHAVHSWSIVQHLFWRTETAYKAG
jgi:hypothetical protein